MFPCEDSTAAAAATPIQSHGLAAAQDTVQDVDMGHMLTFGHPGLEREFVSSVNRTWARNDGVMLCVSMAITLWAVLKSMHTNKVVFGCQILLLCAEVILLNMVLRNPDGYKKWRLGGLCWLKPVICAIYGISVQYRDASQIWQADTLSAFVMQSGVKSALLPLMYSTVGGQLPFRYHIPVILMCSSSFWGWMTSLRAACMVDTGVRSLVHTLGWKTEVLMTTISLMGFPANVESLAQGEYPCWQVGLFYGILLGMLVPTFIIYIRECNSRVAFLKARVNDRHADKWNELKLERLSLAAICFLVCSQAAWFMIRLTEGAEEVTEVC